MSAPPPLSRARREKAWAASVSVTMGLMIAVAHGVAPGAFSHAAGRELDRLHDPRIGSAAAEMAVHVLPDLRIRGLRILRQELGRLHDHSADAVAAMGRLLVDEGLLQRMQRGRRRQLLLLGMPGRQAFERGDGFARHVRHRRHAGADLDPVGEHRAGAALRQPAAELRPVQGKLVREHIKERRIGIGGDRPGAAVHFDAQLIRHRGAPIGDRPCCIALVP